MKPSKKVVTVLVLTAVLLPFYTVSAPVDTPVYDPISVIPGMEEEGPVPTLDVYLNIIFDLALGIATILAILQLTYGAVLYMTSDVVGKKEESKERMRSSIFGLLLLLSTYLILYQINPEMVEFKLTSPPPTGERQSGDTPHYIIAPSPESTCLPNSAYPGNECHESTPVCSPTGYASSEYHCTQ
jgi:hypothetical protein